MRLLTVVLSQCGLLPSLLGLASPHGPFLICTGGRSPGQAVEQPGDMTQGICALCLVSVFWQHRLL